MPISRRNKNVGGKQNALQIFRKSRFYISVLLITTFLRFVKVPDLVYLFVGILNKNDSSTLLTACWVSYAVANLSDAYIYIFMQRDVRHLLSSLCGSVA